MTGVSKLYMRLLSRQSLSVRANGVSLLYIAKDLRSVK